MCRKLLCSNVKSSSVRILFCLTVLAFSADAGVVLRLYYREIPGDTVADLTNHSSFPDQPASAEPLIDSLETATENGDKFGSWTRGYLEAPQTGDYIFLLASDDQSELWLSSNHLPEGRKKIAENLHHVRFRDYYATTPQRSEAIPLVKGEEYYFELFHKDGLYGDHISVGWKLPDDTVEAPIPGSRLLPFPVNDSYEPLETAPTILTDYFGQPIGTLTNIAATEGQSVTFSVSVAATPPVTFQWFRNQQPIPDANLSTYSLPKVSLTNDVDLFAVIVSNKLGKADAEAILSVSSDTIAPTVVSVLDLGASNSLAVFFSKPVDVATATKAENYLVDEVLPKNVKTTSNPKMVLLEMPRFSPGGLRRLQVKNVKDMADLPNLIVTDSFDVESGLKAWLTFDDLASARAADASGNRQSAALVGDAPVKTETNGSCLNFNGRNNYGKFPEGMSDFVGGLTMALWVKPTAVKSWARFVEFGNGPENDNIIFARYADSGALYFGVYDRNVTSPGIIAANAIELDKWQHFAASIDSAGHAAIYKNGSLLRSGMSPVPRVQRRTHNYIGRSNWEAENNEYFEGAMDELRIYDRALTAEEIKALSETIPILK